MTGQGREDDRLRAVSRSGLADMDEADRKGKRNKALIFMFGLLLIAYGLGALTIWLMYNVEITTR